MNGKTIALLLIEDNPGDARLIETYLSQASFSSFRIHHVHRLEEAVSTLQEQTFGAVLLDLGLPDSRGLDTFHSVKQAGGESPILILTGLDNEDLALQSVQAGAQDYLLKDHIDEYSLPRAVHYAVERSKIQRDLQEQKRQLSTLMGNLQGMVYRCYNQPDWPMLFVSRGAEALTGYTPEELTNQDKIAYGEVIHPQDRDWVWETVQEALSRDDSFQIQYRIITRENDVRWVREEGNAIDTGEDPVLLEGYISDITDRVESKNALRESERRYRLLAETAQDYIVVHDMKGRITYINQAGLEFSGYTEEEILHQPVSAFIPGDHTSGLKERQAQRESGDRSRHLFETEFVNKEGGKVPVEVSSSPIVKDGEVNSILLVARDIRKRVEAERALRESEEKFRSLVDQAAEMLFLHDLEGEILEVNEAAIRNTGYSREELENLSVFDIDPEAQDREDNIRYWRSLKPQDPPVTFETSHKRKDASLYLAEASISKVVLQNGEYILALARDITGRKKAQEKLQESELRYRTIFNSTPVAIWEEDFSGVADALQELETEGVTDLGRYLDEHPEFVDRAMGLIEVKDVNEQTLRMFGAESKEELLGSFRDTVTPETKAILREELLAIHEGKNFFEGETVNRTLQGERLNVLLNMSIPDKGSMDSVLISMMDITDRKQAERDYRNLYKSIRDAILIANTDREITDCNPAFREIFGYSLDEIKGKQTAYLYEDREQFQELGQKLKEHEGNTDFFYTVNYRKKSGEVFPGETNVFYLRDGSGETEAFVGMIRDVTERQEAKRALEAREKKFRAIFNNANDAMYLHKINEEGLPGRFIEINEIACEMLGYSREELLAMSPRDIDDSDGASQVPEIMQRLFKEGDLTFEMQHVTKEGKKVPVEVSSHLFTLNQEQVVLSNARDITERRKARQKLKESEERYRSLFESVPIGLYRTTFDGELTDANQALVEMLGYPDRESLLNVKALDFYVDPGDQHTWRKLIEEQGEIRGFETRFYRYDNEIIWVQDNTRVVYDEEGNPQAYQGSLENITQRKRSQEALQQRSRQMEVLREIGVNLASELDVNDLLKMIVEQAIDLVDGQAGSFNRFDPAQDILDLDVHMGYSSLPEETALQKGQGLIGKVWEQQETIQVDDYQAWEGHDPRWADHFEDSACIGLPVTWGGEFIGVLEVLRESGNSFSDDEAHLLELFAAQAAVAMHNAHLFDHAQERLSRLQALREVDQTVSGSLDLKTTLNVLLDRLEHNLGVDAGSILLYDPPLQTLDYYTGFGFRSNAVPDSGIRIGEGQTGRAALERKTIHIPDLTLETVQFERAKLIRREEFVSYFGVPLIAKGEIVGVLEVFHREFLQPDKEWINFLETLAGQAAIAIDRLNLFDNLERSNMELIRAYNEVIEGWARALELRDQETEGHSRRVEQLTLTMAREMGIRESKIADIRQGTLLHDIGKMGIPDSILQKPGKLTEEEWEMMRKHPTFAYEMLSPIDHLKSALEIPYCHHEKWDGSGYPRGLKGGEIPLPARIFAVVDVWDALRSDRPYRDAWSDEKALAYIKEQSGTHFDPRVVEVFLKVVGEL